MYATIAQAVIIVLLVLFSLYSWGEKKDLENQLSQTEKANTTLLSTIEQLKDNYANERKVLEERHAEELKNNIKYEKVIKYVYENPETNTSKRFDSVLNLLQFDSNSSN